MTLAAAEALDWLEGWLLGFTIASTEDCAQALPTALEQVDVIRAAFPATSPAVVYSEPKDGAPEQERQPIGRTDTPLAKTPGADNRPRYAGNVLPASRDGE